MALIREVSKSISMFPYISREVFALLRWGEKRKKYPRMTSDFFFLGFPNFEEVIDF